MANPERYITISDFKAGIWGDLHAPAQDAARSIAGDVAGAIPQNGAARIAGTTRCRADKTGALIPLPKATFDRSFGSPTPGTNIKLYLLDAQVGFGEGSDDIGQIVRPNVYTLWGHWDPVDNLSYVRGRQYRDPIWGITAPLTTYDFLMVKGTVTQSTLLNPLIPPGSLCTSRFYYGNTTPGAAEAGSDTSFRIRWSYPVVVALVSSPAGALHKIKRHAVGTNSHSFFKPQISHPPGGGSAAVPYSYWSPSVGGGGEGGVVLAMSFNNSDAANLPIDTTRDDTWYFHYNCASHQHLANLDEAMNNPYMVISHQQRIVLADRRLSAPYLTMYLSTGERPMRVIDDLLWYSDVGLPMQDFDMVSPHPLTYSYADNDATGTTNTGYQNFPPVIQSAYNKLQVGDDLFSQIGTFGVVNYDQLLVIKHAHGGVLVSGDLDTPTVRRLPYIEPTGGLIMKGAQTPIGFVYGSPNGVFAWQGGEQTKKLSPQIDGFFWDHTDGTDAEIYTGPRGRFAYWNGLILCPNSYAFDIETESWWRLGVTDLHSHSEFVDSTVLANHNPFNVYDTDDRFMYAFPYKTPTAAASLAWYSYDPLVLDNRYTWQSHPLIETQGRAQQFQEVRILATAHKEHEATIKVTLTGLDVDGDELVSTEVLFNLAPTDDPQLLTRDIEPNFTAEYVTVAIDADSNSGDTLFYVTGFELFESTPAPKIHSIALGVKDGPHTRRHG